VSGHFCRKAIFGSTRNYHAKAYPTIVVGQEMRLSKLKKALQDVFFVTMNSEFSKCFVLAYPTHVVG
jgi:hypothetical protein